MSVKFHKHNTNFQIRNFLVGSCHTPDIAYFQLLELLEDRQMALDAYNVSKLEREEKRKNASDINLLKMSNAEKYEKPLYEALMDEMTYIQSLIEEVKPLRKYADKTDIVAHELAQEEEWLLELKNRIENYLLTQGFIPHDEFKTMRMHPQFKEELLPYLKNVQLLSSSPQGRLQLEEGMKKLL